MYATKEFHPFDVVGEYVGRVVPPTVGGEYVATIDWEDARFEKGAGHLWGVDSKDYGWVYVCVCVCVCVCVFICLGEGEKASASSINPPAAS